jgi:parallel beta-helix repeat protein
MRRIPKSIKAITLLVMSGLILFLFLFLFNNYPNRNVIQVPNIPPVDNVTKLPVTLTNVSSSPKSTLLPMTGNYFYVSTTGNDSNPGTSAQPWLTISKAAKTMVAGDTVFIHGGSYYENVQPINSGSSNKYITYRDFGDGDVIIDGQSGRRPYCITINNKSYLQFINLHLQNAGYDNQNAGFVAYAGSNHLNLNGIISENSRFGIMLKGSNTSSENPFETVNNVIIENSIIRNNAAYGIFVYYKVTDVTIGPNNHIYNENSSNGVPVDDQYGINLDTNYPGNPANGPRRIKIIGNEVNGNRIQGIRPWNSQYLLIKDNYVHDNGATGIQIEDGSSHIIIEGNRSEYNSQSYEYETGIWVDSAEDVVVRNNVMRGNKIGFMVTDSTNTVVHNNLIYENNRGYDGKGNIETTNSIGANLNPGAATTLFFNNTLWRNGTTSSSKGNLTLCAATPVTDLVIKNNIFSEATSLYDVWINPIDCGFISDYNNFYNTRDLSIYYRTGLNWTRYLSLSGQDVHSTSINPQFTNPQGYDFTLNSNSPDIDSGIFLTQTDSAGSGTNVVVKDARYFSDGKGLISGDTINIGLNIVTITAINYAGNSLIIDRSINWNKGDGVSFPYNGSGPDKGAFESGIFAIPK